MLVVTWILQQENLNMFSQQQKKNKIEKWPCQQYTIISYFFAFLFINFIKKH